MKKKYKVMKKDDSSYEDLTTDYERKEMPDYSFKSKSDAMGKNSRKLQRNKIIRAVLCVIGAILVLYLGYFIIEVTKQVNNRAKGTTAAYTLSPEETQGSTTFPDTTASESTSENASGSTSETETTYPSSQASESSESGTTYN